MECHELSFWYHDFGSVDNKRLSRAKDGWYKADFARFCGGLRGLRMSKKDANWRKYMPHLKEVWFGEFSSKSLY